MPEYNIQALPEELLETVLGFVKDSAPSESYWNCLKTCHQWHRIGLGLYEGLGYAASAIIESDSRRCDVREGDSQSDFNMSFNLDLAPPSHLYLSLMKCLTIHIHHRRVAASISPLSRGDLVESLEKVFSLTKRLTTFSLRFSDGWDFPRLDVPAVPQSMLARLISVLPDTVINLELDTAGTDLPPSTELISQNAEYHLCYQISKILMRLQHLRLRVGHVCDGLHGRHPNARPCQRAESCEFCATNEQSACAFLSSSKMRSMTIWLPWGQTAANNSFVRASAPLLNPSFRNPTIFLLIHQIDNRNPERTSIVDPAITIYKNFSWTPQSNVSNALRDRLEYFRFKSISGSSHGPVKGVSIRKAQMEQDRSRPCTEHEIIVSTQLRRFHISPSLGTRPEPGSTSPYSYMAEQTVENMLSWTQNSHLGYRFPLPEADEPGKPFWKHTKLWRCRFPDGCKERCETLIHLRGHHMYAHPGSLHHREWQGYQPCPSLGCDRIGANGFKAWAEVEEHLLGHHLEPCAFLRDTYRFR
ncbi:hypothetical protein BKA66DRAFT_415572 [Pyrenochaeta sp. MPI-SDFR-AT-0127]|nr:hypothetical protein BKA66DRAFT_415572 [Pyrenochaeta sp. MPI-SDFR-AT-0127]